MSRQLVGRTDLPRFRPHVDLLKDNPILPDIFAISLSRLVYFGATNAFLPFAFIKPQTRTTYCGAVGLLPKPWAHPVRPALNVESRLGVIVQKVGVVHVSLKSHERRTEDFVSPCSFCTLATACRPILVLANLLPPLKGYEPMITDSSRCSTCKRLHSR
ncbi:hypothetical protein BDU57DRAFT_248909 [Ampelomyces quisqualis]|uniref:Uncharacterized protein n=1 Tax=Ampelomyces quisqualis TaxID=50730 RepID=A0A6A5QQD2_AMPQU|nr:hypothetical protein BDU57DRAFT_248909 [Ampelomyces quisqualis]